MQSGNRDVVVIEAALKVRGFHTSRIWLQDCIDFYRSENNQYTVKQLEEFVCEQWLLADLRDIGVGCFPPNLSNQMKVVLSGKMACQVEFVRDIGHPAYTQIQRIRKEDVGNLELEDKTNQYQQAWEPKANRVLLLSLCDGIQNVEAIEYKPIPNLKTDLLPGSKVVLKGPLQCRRGMILLENHNLQICGGEVESLVISNAYENVLARALNLPENPDPHRAAPQDSTQSAFPPLQYPAQPQAPQPQPARTQPASVQLQSQFEQTASRHQNPANTWPASGRSKPMTQQLLSSSSSKKEQLPVPSYQPQVSTTDREFPDDEDLMLVDLNPDDWSAEMEFEQNMADIYSWDRPSENSCLDRTTQARGKEAIKSTSCSLSNPSTAARSTNNYADCDSAFSLGPDDDDEIFLKVQDTVPLNTTAPKMFPLFKKSTTSSAKQTESYSKYSSASVTSKAMNSNANGLRTGVKRPAPMATAQEREKKLLLTKSSSQEVSSTSDVGLKINDDIVIDEELELLTSEAFDDPASKQEFREMSCDGAIQYIPAAPFVYLSQIVSLQSKQSRIYRVKAAVITVVEKLTISGDEWRLAAKISDGSTSVTVRFSPAVLEEIIGMSAVSLRLMRKEMESQPLKKEMVRKNFERAQNRMVSLNCLLDIEWVKDGIPVVVGVEELRPSTVSSLKERMLQNR